MKDMKIQAPWVTFHNMVSALFELDPDIIVCELYEDNEFDYAFDIHVEKHDKYVALDRAMPKVRQFGNVDLIIRMYDEENVGPVSDLDIYRTLFEGNRIVKDFKINTLPDGQTHVGYVRFEPEVIQFFNDDLTDYSGNWSGLAEDIANIVFCEDNRGIYFCTAAVNENDNPTATPVE